MFPEGTVTDLEKTGKASVQINLDASDPNEATTIESYVQAFITQFQQDESKMPGSAFTINGEVKMLYNPQMKSSYSFVPGLMGMLLMLICCMMTALSIVREKERGTMEILLISPLRPLTIVAAKAIPYFVISLVDVVLIMLVSHFVMGVPVAGNLLTILLVSAMFTLSCLALGLLISTVASDQQIAMMISVVAMMLPTMLLSGVMFPIESLPAFLQILSYIIPARWFIASIREIMIKGMGIDVVWEEVCILLCMTIFLVTVSVKNFKNRL
jgi:ABC-2 type transport system permease protein